MEDKEKIYDEQIFPLMKSIIEICKKEDIPMFAEFQYQNKGYCKTIIHQNAEGVSILPLFYEALSQCREDDGVNIDKFFIHLAKNYANKSSVVMSRLQDMI